MDPTEAYRFASTELVGEIRALGCVRGELSSSALATAVAAFALHLGEAPEREERIGRAVSWLVRHANADGGWGDTMRSPSNLSTTLLARSALEQLGAASTQPAKDAADAWLCRVAGSADPAALSQAVLTHYGKDRTFSIPILTMCALGGLLGPAGEAWQRVPQLPLELAAFPHGLYRFVGLPVVSYALPALIAMGLVRHRLGGGGGLLRPIRSALTGRLLDKLASLQPENGGFLEATPLTGFVALSLSACGFRDHLVVRRAMDFLTAGQRPDGAWPIDTDLATWLTTLAVKELGEDLPEDLRPRLRRWLLDQQFRERHPFTNSPPGGWGWTDLPGSVPDADDTAGALLALRRLGPLDDEVRQAGEAGVRWLLGLTNRDGGTPTFCRGWGKLPFDASSPDLTIHALQAYTAWQNDLPTPLRQRVQKATTGGLRYLANGQRPDGSWVPLWFGNDGVPGHENPVYGTARVVAGLRQLAEAGQPLPEGMLARGVGYLLGQRNQDGGWGGCQGVPSSIEETSLAVAALAGQSGAEEAVEAGKTWLAEALKEGKEPVPIGLYFASLWYFEARYPLVLALPALRA
jgi:squalene-hopene/tetraprenyl-beta-curcumene cyclase